MHLGARRLQIVPALVAMLVLAGAADAAPDPPSAEAAAVEREDVVPAAPAFADPCGTIEAAAVTHGLPLDFFTRLLWQESRFRPDAVSPKGAQGIAQFMPGTAADRGLADPFNPDQAIWAAASLLADLRRTFGNLGLAAAAYNGGPTRVSNWLAGSGGLPYETQTYVRIITGHPAESWSVTENRDGLDVALLGEPKKTTCPEIKLALARGAQPAAGAGTAAAKRSPWGVQLAGSFSQNAALRMFANLKLRYGRVLAEYDPEIISRRSRARGRRVFHRVRVGAQTRTAASELCQRLRQAGAGCLVMRN
jgi:hypothetical protein